VRITNLGVKGFLMEAFSYQGIWWLPDNAEDVLTGTLSFSASEGIKLELVGTFLQWKAALAAFDSMTVNTFPIIHGFTVDGKYTTLVTCTELNPGISFGTIRKQQFRCRVVYLGRKHITTDNPVFSKIYVEYSHLFEWVSLSGFSEQFNWAAYETTLNYQRPEPILVSIDDATISIGHNISTQSSMRSRAYTEQAVCVIERTSALTLDEWLIQYIAPVQDLLSLATDRPNAIMRLTVTYLDGVTDADTNTNIIPF
jgi:hypothetical protein